LNNLRDKPIEHKIKYYNSLSYEVIMKKKENKFYLYMPELSIVTINTNLDKAFIELEKKREKYFTTLLSYDSDHEIRLPNKIKNKFEIYQKMKLFIYKLIIICFLGGITFSLSIALISNKIAEIPDRFDDISIVDNMWKSVGKVKEIIEAPEEIQKERLETFHELLLMLKPFVQELEILFDKQESNKNSDK